MSIATNAEQIRDNWLHLLSELVENIKNWSEALDWSTRRIEVSLQDSEVGKYQAPALLLQQETVRILLEPVTRTAPGVEGVVDLYLMPSYDDIATLYYIHGAWNLHYMFPDSPTVGDLRDAPAKILTAESLENVLNEMKANAIS